MVRCNPLHVKMMAQYLVSHHLSATLLSINECNVMTVQMMAQYLVSQHLSQQYEQSQQHQHARADQFQWPPHFLPSLEASVPSLPAFHNVLAALAASQASAQHAPQDSGSLHLGAFDPMGPRHLHGEDRALPASSDRDGLRPDQVGLQRPCLASTLPKCHTHALVWRKHCMPDGLLIIRKAH